MINVCMNDNMYKFFLENASIFDLKKYCETTGYRLVIFNEREYILQKEEIR